MAGYGWDEYDVRYGGRQIIHDVGNSIDITTEFVKISGGKHGGSWGVRVKGVPREDAPQQLYTTMVFYAGMEGFGSLGVQNQENELGIIGPVIMEGSTTELGRFALEVTEGLSTNRHPPTTHPSDAGRPLDRTRVLSLNIPDGNLWQVKRMSGILTECCRSPWLICPILSEAILFQDLKKTVDEMVEIYGAENAPPPWQLFTIHNRIQDGNLHFVQKVFEGAFEVRCQCCK